MVCAMLPIAPISGKKLMATTTGLIIYGIAGRGLVPQGRIELPTSSLPMMRSTTELLRRRHGQSINCPVQKDARLAYIGNLEKTVTPPDLHSMQAEPDLPSNPYDKGMIARTAKPALQQRPAFDLDLYAFADNPRQRLITGKAI